MQANAAEKIMEYLTSRGMNVVDQDKAEIHARVLGHDSAAAHQAFNEKSKVFFVYRGCLEDFDSKGDFSGELTRAAPALHEGGRDQALRQAFLEAQASGWFYVVYDGNGTLYQMFAEHRPGLVVYRTIGCLKNPDAEFRDELAQDSEMVEQVLYFSWKEVGRVAAAAQGRIKHSRLEVSQQTVLFVTEEGNQKILWRERI